VLLAATFVDGFAEDRTVQVMSAISSVLILFITVLLHEIAHGWVARLSGVGVREYLLTFFGGETSFTAPMPGPGKAAATAAAGPLTNLLLAALLWMVFRVTADDSVLPAYVEGQTGAKVHVIAMVAVYMGAFINLMVGAFNLLPALPLDGGQIVQSLVWRLTGNRERGMVAAGWLGLVVGFGLIVIGLLETRRRLTMTIWLILIGVTVMQGAWASARRGRTALRAASRTVEGFIEPAVAAARTTPLADVAADLARGTWIVVTDRGAPIGYVDPPAAQTALAGNDQTPLDAVMVALPRGVAVPITLSGVALVQSVAPYAATTRLLPVVDTGRLAGVLPLTPLITGL
jgi:Zn-dependent protease